VVTAIGEATHPFGVLDLGLELVLGEETPDDLGRAEDEMRAAGLQVTP